MAAGGEAFKLTTELVPRTSWYSNLRKAVGREAWDRIRKEAYARYGHQCGICGSRDTRLACHEIWAYDDRRHIQRLVGFIALCEWCHHVKHLGLAGILAAEGQLDYERVVEHFMRVNGCDRETFETYKRRVFEQWRARSRHQWTVDLGEYASLVEAPGTGTSAARQPGGG